MATLNDYVGYEDTIKQALGPHICYGYALNANLLLSGRQPQQISQKIETEKNWGMLSSGVPYQYDSNNPLFHLNFYNFIQSFREGDICVFVKNYAPQIDQEAHFIIKTGDPGIFAGIKNPPEITLYPIHHCNTVETFQLQTPEQANNVNEQSYYEFHRLIRLSADSIPDLCSTWAPQPDSCCNVL